MKGYADLADLAEDKRIELIARVVADQKKTVAVALEDDAKKIDRYVRKLHRSRPGQLTIERLPGLVPKTVSLRISPNVSNN